MGKFWALLALSSMWISLVSAQYTLCSYANNTIGTCDCFGQVFISDDCTKAFYCMDFDDPAANYPPEINNAKYDGCVKECRDNEVLIIDPIRLDWSCVPKVTGVAGICPGKFNTECGCNEGPDACPLGECECQEQLRVSDDCHKARYCNGTDFENPSHYVDIECPSPTIVFVNMITHSWSCEQDDGRCPGAFHVGCQDDSPPTEEPTVDPSEDPETQRPFTLCSYAMNDLGTCECPGQVFLAHDCHKGFLCMNFTDGNYPDSVVDAGFDGCVKECREDELLVVDPRLGDWECVPTIVNTALLGWCPGKFNTECACTGGEEECPIGECECQGQLRVAHDCHDARYCNGTDLANPNDHLDISCPAPDIVYVNMATNTWECGPDDGRCPGAFHVGCQDDSYNGSSNLGLSAIMASLLPMCVTFVYSLIRV